MGNYDINAEVDGLLDQFEIQEVDLTLWVTHDRCGEKVAELEGGDALGLFVRMAVGHECPKANEDDAVKAVAGVKAPVHQDDEEDGSW